MKKKTIKINDLEIGNGKLVYIAGPCTISSKDNLIKEAKNLKKIGVNVLRGGTYKLRTNPNSNKGLGKKGLDYLILAKKVTGLPIISEITSIKYLNEYNDVDIIQVGTRNMYNYEMLSALGKINKPILLKRAFSATYEEWLLAAEYIIKNGNKNVILCERGIRTFEKHTRNTLDISAICAIKEMCNLPIIIDPSHASGKRNYIYDLSLAAAACGADGLMIECEDNVENAVCDKDQCITTKELSKIIKKCNEINSLLD